MRKKIIRVSAAVIVLLCFCSTPMRNYLEEPPKIPPPADSTNAKKSDTLSLDKKKRHFPTATFASNRTH